MVAARRWSPERGDLVWLEFNPQAGHEQAGHEQSGRRPALVISPRAYNRKVGLALLCPIKKHIKGYPFEIVLPEGLPVSGAILSDQIKSLDWRKRRAEFICAVPEEAVREALAKIQALVGG